ncbi:mCG1045253 [Mus musculus]|nr:mCG1045253 [Mus musculus]
MGTHSSGHITIGYICLIYSCCCFLQTGN